MYWNMRINVYVLFIYVNICTCVHVWAAVTALRIFCSSLEGKYGTLIMYTCKYMCMNIYIHSYVYLCMSIYVYMYTCTCIYMSIYHCSTHFCSLSNGKYICVYVVAYVYMNIYTCIYMTYLCLWLVCIFVED
jgi:hypothetical protein